MKPVRIENGSSVYSLTSLYDGNPESRQKAAEWLDIDARNLCLSECTLIFQKNRFDLQPDGGGGCPRASCGK